MYLVLDFTANLSLAVFKKDFFMTNEIRAKNNISEILIHEIEAFLKKTKCDIFKIKAIYVITGPGSFTGIRSAITFAKSLRLIRKISIFGLSKFDLINLYCKKEYSKKKKKIFINFKNNQFFVQTFEHHKAISIPKLINLNLKKLSYNKDTAYIFANYEMKKLNDSTEFTKIKANSFFIDYNLNQLPQLVKGNIINKNNVRPLYIGNYY